MQIVDTRKVYLKIMKITYLTDACVLIESNGKKLLCDPWLSESACYGALYHYPRLIIDVEKYLDVDYIYISHIHEDHLDVDTLKKVNKNIPIYIMNYFEKPVLNRLKTLGFHNVIELNHKEKTILHDDFSLEILAADDCDPIICHKFFGCQVSGAYEKTLQIDSLAIISNKEHVVVNTNDCPYELSRTMNPYILSNYNKIDFLLTSYNAASPYPQCFENFDAKEKLAEREKIRLKCLERAFNYTKDLKPKYLLPFAAKMVIGGKNIALNKFVAKTPEWMLYDEIQIPLERMGLLTKLVLLNQGSTFNLITEKADAKYIPPSIEDYNKYLIEISSRKYDYEHSDYVLVEEDLTRELQLALLNVKRKQLEVYPGMIINEKLYLKVHDNYLYELDFKNYTVNVVSKITQVPYLKMTLDYRILKLILERKMHWNNAEFGSFILYDRQPNIQNRTLHHIISYLHN